MAVLPDSGDGDFGVFIEFEDGDTERAWRKNKADRDKVYNHTKGSPGIKKVTKIKRK